MELKRRHLMLAGLVAVALHGAIAVAVFWTPQQRGAVGAGLGGLEISMGATGGAPGLAQPVAPGEASKAESYVTEKLTPDTAPAPTPDAVPAPVAKAAEAPERAPAEDVPLADGPPPTTTVSRAEPAPVSQTLAPQAAVAARPAQTPAEAAVETILDEGARPVAAEAVPEPVVADALPADIVPADTPLAEPAMVDTHADDASVETVDTDPEAVAAEAPQVVPAEASAPQPQEIEVAAVDPVEEAMAAEPVPVTVDATDPAADPATEDAVVAPLPVARPRNVPPPAETRRTARPTEPQQTRQQRQRQNASAPKTEESPARETPTRQAARSGGDAAVEDADTRGSGNSGASGNASSAGQGQRATAGGDPGAKRDYMSRLAAILARHKRYPRRAQSRRQEGVGHLFFVVEASGSVATIRLTKSTGHRLLDEEILAILGRVGRLPPIPDDVGVARLEIVVPVNFNLR